MKTSSTIAAAPLTVNEARLASCSFTTPLELSFQSLFIKNPKSVYNYAAFHEPLTNLAWVVILIYLIILPLLIFLVVFFSGENPLIPLEECYGLVYVAIISLGNTHAPKNISTRIVILW